MKSRSTTFYILHFMFFLSLFLSARGAIGMPPHPDLWEKIKRVEARGMRATRSARFRGLNAPLPKRQPTISGTYKCLVILIGFQDDSFDVPKSTFTSLFNDDNYNGGTGSVNKYYREISYGVFGVSATVVGPYTALYDKSYYAGDNNGCSTNYPENAAGLVVEAVNLADKDGVDFSPFDNDDDGEAESLFVIHAGIGAEDIGGSPADIGSHKWNISATRPGGALTKDGKTVDTYSIEPELNCADFRCSLTKTVGIGVICHEYGHVLGLPDLYDTDYSSMGIGLYGLMALGAWGGDYNSPERPVHMCSWSKVFLGWIEPTEVSLNNPSEQIRDVEQYAEVLKLGGNDEYFLIGNRQRIGFDENLPGDGLLIWHIDEDIIDATIYWNTVNDDENHKGVDLEEADGKYELDLNLSYGDSGDYYPGDTNNRQFTCSSNPSSDYYSGGPSGVEITNISGSASTMSIGITVINTVKIPSKKRSNIFTPNRDGFNDACEFGEVEGSYRIKIYDLTNRLVRTLDNENIWEGKDDDGDLVETGVYIYQIILDGNVETGTVVVAK